MAQQVWSLNLFKNHKENNGSLQGVPTSFSWEILVIISNLWEIRILNIRQIEVRSALLSYNVNNFYFTSLYEILDFCSKITSEKCEIERSRTCWVTLYVLASVWYVHLSANFLWILMNNLVSNSSLLCINNTFSSALKYLP